MERCSVVGERRREERRVRWEMMSVRAWSAAGCCGAGEEEREEEAEVEVRTWLWCGGGNWWDCRVLWGEG